MPTKVQEKNVIALLGKYTRNRIYKRRPSIHCEVGNRERTLIIQGCETARNWRSIEKQKTTKKLKKKENKVKNVESYKGLKLMSIGKMEFNVEKKDVASHILEK